MLQVEQLSLTRHQVGRVLDAVDLVAEPGITLLAGRVGVGSSLLLDRIAGRAGPADVQTSGRIAVDGVPLLGRNQYELADAVRHVGVRPAGSGGLRQLYGTRAQPDWVEQLGLGQYLDIDRQLLPDHIAARAALAEIAHCAAPVILIDQVLAHLTPPWRERAATFIQAHAASGATVLWAEHGLETALGVADTVVEISNRTLTAYPGAHWASAELPRTPLREFARRARLDPARCRTPEAARAALVEAGMSVLTRGTTRPPGLGAELGQVLTRRLGLKGAPVTVRVGEAIGIVADDPQIAIRTARRLAIALRGRQPDDRALAALVAQRRVQAACAAVDQRAGRGSDSTLLAVREMLGPLGSRPGSAHSDGQRTLLAAMMALAVNDITLLVEPTCGVDGYHIARLGQLLGAQADRTLIMATRDIEFAVRHCHRLLVVRGDEIIADGGPAAVLGALPYQPQLAQVWPGQRVVRNSDLSLTTEANTKEQL